MIRTDYRGHIPALVLASFVTSGNSGSLYLGFTICKNEYDNNDDDDDNTNSNKYLKRILCR